MPPIEAKRIEVIIEKAARQWGILERPGLPWMDDVTWTQNAVRLTETDPPVFAKIVLPNGTPFVPEKGVELDELDLSPTAEESIPPAPDEYVRVTRMHLQLARELILVDPFLDPCADRVREVLKLMLNEVGKGEKSERCVKCFANKKKIQPSNGKLESALQSIVEGIEGRTKLKLLYYLVDDSRSKHQMHDRYLLSVKGGVELSKGFQRQSRSKVTARPLSQAVFNEQWGWYVDRKTDMQFLKPLEVVKA